MKRQSIRMLLLLFSFSAFPITVVYLAPAPPIMSLKAGVINLSVITIPTIFISGFIFRRAFCSWLCPGGGCQLVAQLVSALDTLTQTEFIQMMPGLFAMFAKEGWLILIWGLLLLPIGFVIQGIGILRSKSLATWQSLLFIIGVLFIGTPDGVEVVNLTASILIAVALIPSGFKIIAEKN